MAAPLASRFWRKASVLAMLVAGLAQAACGYHLVGHGGGRGVVPEAVHTLNIVVEGETRQFAARLREMLRAEDWNISLDPAEDVQAPDHARLRVRIAPVGFLPSAFDTAGIASQYRMVYRGSLALEYNGETIWRSGDLVEQDEVYVSGDPVGIEAAREQLLRDLRTRWLQTAIGRLRSGF